MPPANDSQGLKIAVAAFVSLTVILAVTSYFLYSSYAQTYEKLAEAQKTASQKETANRKLLEDFENLRNRAGYSKLAEGQELMAAVKNDQEEANKKLAEASTVVADMVSKARAQGTNDPRLADLTQRTDLIVQDFLDEKKTTFASSIDRLVELVSNLAQLTAAFALDNIDLRTKLTSLSQVTDSTIGKQEEVVRATKTDLENEQAKHEQDRQALHVELDKYTSQASQLLSENATLKAQLAQREEEFKKQLGDVSSQMIYWRAQATKSANVMDNPDGTVTYVDYSRREIRTDINRRMGARPQMRLSVFDRNAQGLPTERPKGTIQLIEVGQNDSVARIVQTTSTVEPIRTGDKLYSPVWDPNEPQQYALIGKIDMNRDGRDDRADLTRLIQAAGGQVAYDLPPPSVGRESGELTGRISRYVLDEREAIRGGRSRTSPTDMTPEEERFNQKLTEVIRRADELGIRPISIEQLLPSLGYTSGMTIPGQVEAIDRRTSESLSAPRQRPAATPAGSGNAGPR